MTAKSSGEFKRDLLSSFNANLVLPLYSVFLPLLAYSLKASEFEIGLVGGAANAVYCFMPFLMGRFSDKAGARRFLITSSFVVLSLVSVSYIYVRDPVTLIALRILEGIGWAMLWPAIEAAIRNSSTDGRRELSLFNFTWSGAAAIGPLLGSAIIFVTTIREAFVVTSVIIFVTLLLNGVPLITRRNSPAFETHQNLSDPILAQSARFGASFYLPSMVLSAISVGVLYTFLTPYAKSIHMSILLVGVATLAFGLTRFLMYLLTARERFRSLLLYSSHRARNVVLSLVVLSLSSLLVFIRDPSGLIYVISYGVGGICVSLVYAVSQAVLIAESDPEKVGRSAGMFESSIGIGQSLGPIIGGAISGGSYSMPFVFPSLSLIVFLLAIPVMIRKRYRIL